MTLDNRPDGVTDATVEAMGTVGEALEYVERARGRLYDFHQLMGRADLLMGEAVDALRDAGHDDAADLLATEVVGRNVLPGRWTFQIVEDYDDTYWQPLRDIVARLRDELVAGHRHLFEAEMKADRITPGHPDHAPAPADVPQRED